MTIVRQFSMKAGWRDASQELWDFSRSNKQCIHFSTTKTIYFSCLVWNTTQMAALAPIVISFSNTIWNKSAAGAWICLAFFLWWRMVERKTSFLHVFSTEYSLSSLKCKCDIIFSVFFSLDQNLMETWKRIIHHTFNNKLLIILKLYVHYLHYFLDLSIKSKMEKRGFIHTKIKNTDGWK